MGGYQTCAPGEVTSNSVMSVMWLVAFSLMADVSTLLRDRSSFY
jgi:hypothetical protein